MVEHRWYRCFRCMRCIQELYSGPGPDACSLTSVPFPFHGYGSSRRIALPIAFALAAAGAAFGALAAAWRRRAIQIARSLGRLFHEREGPPTAPNTCL